MHLILLKCNSVVKAEFIVPALRAGIIYDDK